MNITIEIMPSLNSGLTINLSRSFPSSEKEKEFTLSYTKDYYEENYFPIITLTEKEWNDLTEELNDKIDISPRFIFGIDGITYQIIISNGFNTFIYSLWSPKKNENNLCRFINKVLNKINETEYLIKK